MDADRKQAFEEKVKLHLENGDSVIEVVGKCSYYGDSFQDLVGKVNQVRYQGEVD